VICANECIEKLRVTFVVELQKISTTPWTEPNWTPGLEHYPDGCELRNLSKSRHVFVGYSADCEPERRFIGDRWLGMFGEHEHATVVSITKLLFEGVTAPFIDCHNAA